MDYNIPEERAHTWSGQQGTPFSELPHSFQVSSFTHTVHVVHCTIIYSPWVFSQKQGKFDFCKIDTLSHNNYCTHWTIVTYLVQKRVFRSCLCAYIYNYVLVSLPQVAIHSFPWCVTILHSLDLQLTSEMAEDQLSLLRLLSSHGWQMFSFESSGSGEEMEFIMANGEVVRAGDFAVDKVCSRNIFIGLSSVGRYIPSLSLSLSS